MREGRPASDLPHVVVGKAKLLEREIRAFLGNDSFVEKQSNEWIGRNRAGSQGSPQPGQKAVSSWVMAQND